jgi:hypothetical protein
MESGLNKNQASGTLINQDVSKIILQKEKQQQELSNRNKYKKLNEETMGVI